MNKKFLSLIILVSSLQIVAQTPYGLKSITVYENGKTCAENLSNPNSLLFCDWSKAMDKCKNEIYWIKYYCHDGKIYEGAAIQMISVHPAWVKEFRIYDSEENLLVSRIDSLSDMRILKKIGINRAKEYLDKHKRFMFIDYEKDGTSKIRTGEWPLNKN